MSDDHHNDTEQKSTTEAGSSSRNYGGDATASGKTDGRGRSYTEEFRVSSEAVVGKIKELVHEGNVRRITIKNDDGRTLLEIPLTLGVIGTAILPVFAAVGAMAALVANLTIAVERAEPAAPETEKPT